MSEREKASVTPLGGGESAKPVPRIIDHKVDVGTARARSRSHKDANMLALNESTTDPTRVYRWVRSREDEYHQSVSKHKMRGYSLETVNGSVKTIVEPDNRPDGAIAIGDLVLMSIPREVYEERQTAKLQATEAKLNSTSAQTKETAKEKGIEIIADPDHNKETQEIR